MADDRKLLREAPPVYRFLAVLSWLVCAPFVKFHLQREEIAHKEKSGIVICNHRTYFDAVVGLIAFHRLGRYPRVVVASEYFDMRIIGWMLRSAGAIPLDRDKPETFDAAAAAVLGAGIPIMVLPEGKLAGTMGEPTTMGSFRPGAPRIAWDHSVPVWAIAHVGCDLVWPRGTRFPKFNPFRRKHVYALCDTEIQWMSGDLPADIAMLEARMQGLLDENLALNYPSEDIAAS